MRFKAFGPTLGYYLFRLRTPPGIVGHNPLAGVFYTIVFLCFLLHMLGPISNDISGPFGDLLWFLSTSGHFENIARGVIDLRDLLYYLSVAIIGLSIATVTLSSRRW